MASRGMVRTALALLCMAAASAASASFQFEVLGASTEWVVVRESLRAPASATDACRYSGLDPSEYIGVRVRFVRLSDEAKRGKLTSLLGEVDAMPLLSPTSASEGCTSAAQAEQRWQEIVTRAQSMGIDVATKPPTPTVLGVAVPAKACVLIAAARPAAQRCDHVYTQSIEGRPIRIALLLRAIPEAPDERNCQFFGHRFGVVIQVDGLDFGSIGSGAAPGGFANHYDCRSQQFEPLRLYRMAGLAVLLGGFRATNMADRDEYPFVVMFRSRAVP